MTFLAHAGIILVCIMVVLIVASALTQLVIIAVIRQKEAIRKIAAQDVATAAVQQYNAAMSTFRDGFMAEFNKMGNAYVERMNEVVKDAEGRLTNLIKQAADSAAGRKSQVM